MLPIIVYVGDYKIKNKPLGIFIPARVLQKTDKPSGTKNCSGWGCKVFKSTYLLLNGNDDSASGQECETKVIVYLPSWVFICSMLVLMLTN